MSCILHACLHADTYMLNVVARITEMCACILHIWHNAHVRAHITLMYPRACTHARMHAFVLHADYARTHACNVHVAMHERTHVVPHVIIQHVFVRM
jgi:hypothetical protein